VGAVLERIPIKPGGVFPEKISGGGTYQWRIDMGGSY